MDHVNMHYSETCFFLFCLLLKIIICASNSISVFSKMFLRRVAPWDVPYKKNLWSNQYRVEAFYFFPCPVPDFFSCSETLLIFVTPDFSPNTFDCGAQGAAIKRCILYKVMITIIFFLSKLFAQCGP